MCLFIPVSCATCMAISNNVKAEEVNVSLTSFEEGSVDNGVYPNEQWTDYSILNLGVLTFAKSSVDKFISVNTLYLEVEQTTGGNSITLYYPTRIDENSYEYDSLLIYSNGVYHELHDLQIACYIPGYKSSLWDIYCTPSFWVYDDVTDVVASFFKANTLRVNVTEYDIDGKYGLKNNYEFLCYDDINISYIYYFDIQFKQLNGLVTSDLSYSYNYYYEHILRYNDRTTYLINHAYKDGYDKGNHDGFISGKEDGYNLGKYDGYSIGYEEGYDFGYQGGKFTGYEEGYNSREPFDTITKGINSLLDISLFGGFTVGTMLGIVVAISFLFVGLHLLKR